MSPGARRLHRLKKVRAPVGHLQPRVDAPIQIPELVWSLDNVPRQRTGVGKIIDVTVGAEVVSIDRATFVALLNNSVVHSLVAYTKTLDRGHIAFRDLVELCRKAEVPYPLLFAPRSVVEEQLAAKTEKLLAGVSKSQYSMAARGSVELRDIELIVKDLLRKQELYKKHVVDLPVNPLVGSITRAKTPEDDAQSLFGVLGLSGEELRSQNNKEKAVECYINRLESAHVLVARSTPGYMPQTLSKVKFSGFAVRDPRAPYLFLAGGTHGEDEEPEGRQLFTLALLTVLIGRKMFRAVTMDATALLNAPPPEYAIAGEMLMPGQLVRSLDLSSLPSIKEGAGLLKVTPSALVVRAQNLKIFGWDVASAHLHSLADEHRRRTKPSARQPKPVHAVRKYNGRRFAGAMLDAVDTGALSEGDFCRVVGARKIKPEDLPDLRQALR